MPPSIVWYYHNDEWVKLYKESSSYYFVDVLTYGRGMCFGAAPSNTYSDKPKYIPGKIPLDRVRVFTERKISIDYVEEAEKVLFRDTCFSFSQDMEAIEWGGESTKITVTETVTKIEGWNNTHVCSYCEESSVTPNDSIDLSAVTCNCGSTGRFVTMEHWLSSSGINEIPYVGQTVTVTREGR
jgi:hypothetical protein